jgi:hypothetical protein
MRTVLKKERSFKTSDINLATTLYTLGGILLGIEREDSHRCCFIFDETDDTLRAIKAYWRRELALDPQSLLLNLKVLKARLYGERYEASN